MSQRPMTAPQGESLRRATSAVGWAAGLAAATFVLAGVAVYASPSDHDIAGWWPAAGVAVLALAHRPRSWWPAVALVVWASSSVANGVIGERPALVAVGLGLANTVEAVVVAAVLLRGRGRAALETLDDVLRLVVATVLGVLTMGVLAGLTTQLAGYGDMLTTARIVMPSHGAAILVVVPLGMRLLRPSMPARRSELAVQSVALLAAYGAVFAPGQHLPLTFAPLPLLVWGALRQSPRVVAVQTAAVAVLVTSLSVSGGPFVANLGPSHAVSLAQAYLIMMVMVGAPLSVSVAVQRLALEEAVTSERLLRTGFSESLLGMLIVQRSAEHDAPALGVVDLNPVAASILGGSEDELRGTDLRERLCTFDRELLDDAVPAMVAGDLPSWRGEVAVRDGRRTRWVDLSISALPSTVGPGMLVVQAIDVSARREAEERLVAQALQDALTGLANRTLLRDRIRTALAALGPRRTDPTAADPGAGTPDVTEGTPSVAVLFCDLDDFKHVNDSVGHSIGDLVLVEVARRLTRVGHPDDLVARHGGDEFVILRPRASGPCEVEEFADEVLAGLAEPIVVAGHTFTVGASIGMVLGDQDATPEGLLRDADAAMYAAKAEGRRRAVLFSDDHRARALRAVRLEGELRRGLVAGEVTVHMQPVVDLATGRVVAAEALARWQHPVRGTLLPVEWLDVAETCGLMPDLGAFVLERSCALAAAWPVHDGVAPAVHVNVSARQLERTDFVDVVTGALERTGLTPERLVLEFTETYLDEVTDGMLADLVRLRETGIGLAADDYGTGYSPLTRVIELPLSMIKIDRGFVSRVLVDRRSREVVTTLVRLGEGLGLDVVAEGIETAEQAAALRVVGCGLGQGYLWSRPVPGERFADLLEEPLGPPVRSILRTRPGAAHG